MSEWPRGFTVKALPMSMDELIMRTLIHNTVMTDHSSYTFKTREEAEAFFIAAALRERARQSSDFAPRHSAGNREPDARKEKTRSRRAL
ncbi:MAG: hypothetical protein IRZ06_02385 [Nevskia sp.]|nr:hypothetical protein [Nevskia sp.]